MVAAAVETEVDGRLKEEEQRLPSLMGGSHAWLGGRGFAVSGGRNRGL
jgi:hypothetical protein